MAAQAVDHLVGQPDRLLQRRGELFGRERLRQRRREQRSQIGRRLEEALGHHADQAPLHGAPSFATPIVAGVVGAHFFLLDQQHREREVGVRKQMRDADQLAEDRRHRAALGRLAATEHAVAVGPHFDDPPFQRHRQDQPHGMVFGQNGQLVLDLPDVARLDLDPEVIARDIHDIAVEFDLHAIAGPRVALLERRVQGVLVQRADRGHLKRSSDCSGWGPLYIIRRDCAGSVLDRDMMHNQNAHAKTPR